LEQFIILKKNRYLVLFSAYFGFGWEYLGLEKIKQNSNHFPNLNGQRISNRNEVF